MDILMGLRRAVQTSGACPAVIDGSTRLTWSMFDRRTRALAAGLRGLGLAPGDRVALLLRNSLRYLELYYAIPRMGGIVVPLNTRLVPPELAFLLDDSGAHALVVDDAALPLLGQLVTERPHLHHVLHAGTAPTPAGVIGYETLVEGTTPRDDADLIPQEDDVVGLFYTGGTTGRAKGVMLTHRNLVANALHVAIHAQMRQEDTYLHVAPMFHVADGAATFAMTMLGGCHTFLPGFTPHSLLETIQRERVTWCVLVPTMITALVQLPGLGDYDLSSWRLLLYGASPISPEVLRRALARLPCALAQGYGQTEAAPAITWLSMRDHREIGRAAPASLWAQRAASCGHPVVGTEVRIVDSQDGEVAPGEIGELLVRGPQVMPGYWNRPEETAAALRGGWLHTGDLARADGDGYLYLVDRKKDMIISGGENVYSVEVENALYAHPAVLEAAVIGVSDATWGERVHAVVVLKPDQAVSAEALRASCRALIAGYKVPRSIEFRDALPKNGAGKVLKGELRAEHWCPDARQVESAC